MLTDDLTQVSSHLHQLQVTLSLGGHLFPGRPATDAFEEAETPCPSLAGKMSAHDRPETTHHASADRPSNHRVL